MTDNHAWVYGFLSVVTGLVATVALLAWTTVQTHVDTITTCTTTYVGG